MFSGREETDVVGKLKGFVYFENMAWQNGSVNYNNTLYENVLLKYNLVSQQLVTQHPGGYLRIQLIKEKIQSFTIAGHVFVHINKVLNDSKNSTKDFYEVLWDKKMLLIGSYSKKILESIVDNQTLKEVVIVKEFFLKQDNQFIKVKNEDSFEDFFKEKELKEFANQNNLDFKKSPESSFVKLFQFIESDK